MPLLQGAFGWLFMILLEMTYEPSRRTDYCVRYDKTIQQWADHSYNDLYSVLCESKIDTAEVSSAIYTDGTTHTSFSSSTVTKSDTIIINIPFWNTWNPWSFCEFHRQRNILNRIEYQILNVSCSLICKYNY